tara:strand:- start:129499 stop:130260 length:762 start_codon:yes stop_codon:yes gene_type:complete
MAAKGLSESQAKKFLQDSGLDALISSMPEAMEQQLDLQRLTEKNKLKLASVKSATSKAAQHIDNQRFALNYLTKQADAERLKGAIEFLKTPLGRKVVVEERAASSAEAQTEMQAYTKSMATSPPSPERIKLIQDLADSLNSDLVLMSLMKGTFYSLLDITRALNPDMAATLKAGLDEEWYKLEPKISAQFNQYMVVGAHYSYRNLSDAEVEGYMDFLNTPSGQAYWKTGIAIINLYMQEFIKELVSNIKASKK